MTMKTDLHLVNIANLSSVLKLNFIFYDVSNPNMISTLLHYLKIFYETLAHFMETPCLRMCLPKLT